VSRSSGASRLRCQGPPMTIAQSTHRNESLARRRPVERAAAARNSTHLRPGAGFLPLRLPVARSRRPGYRIYSVDDFVRGYDAEPAAGVPAAAHRVSPRLQSPRSRRVTAVAVLLAATASAAAIVLTAAWSRASRTGTRTERRSGPTPRVPSSVALPRVRTAAYRDAVVLRRIAASGAGAKNEHTASRRRRGWRSAARGAQMRLARLHAVDSTSSPPPTPPVPQTQAPQPGSPREFGFEG
jgi:hypothetical protein